MGFVIKAKSGEKNSIRRKLMKEKIIGGSSQFGKPVGCCLALGAAVMVSLTSLAQPVNYNIDLSGLGYGNISQNTPGINLGAEACVPTATVNSFFFLQNYYGISGLGPGNGQLTVGNATNAVNELGVDMGLTNNGVTQAGFIAGKWQYLSDHQLTNQISMEWESVAVGGVTPTWQWIYNQLMATQDVEVAFAWFGGSDGHCVTVTSFDFADNNNNHTIDFGELAHLDFTDPWDGQHYVGTLTMNGGSLELSYVGGAAGAGAWGLIDAAIAESPIPEPSTLGLLVIGGLAGFRLLQRKRS
jgi:hypothetical protein